MLGNKGAVAVRLTVDNRAQLLLVCCHLAAHADQVASRNLDYRRIVSGLFQDKQASARRCVEACDTEDCTEPSLNQLKLS
jgi:hypothetical protein